MNDTPVSPREKRDSQYAGGQAALSLLTHQHNANAGFYGFYQSDVQLFSLQAKDGSGQNLLQRDKPTGRLAAAFLEDQFKSTNWLTLTAGVRFTHFDSFLRESIGSPRVGAAVRLPRLGWVLRAFYGRYYQAPPLSTVSGPFIDLALDQVFAFSPLRGERDEEKQFGLTIPLRGWALDMDYFRTGVKNLFDHNALADSNIFFPLTIERGRIRGWEMTLNSPRLLRSGTSGLCASADRRPGCDQWWADRLLAARRLLPAGP